MTTPQDDELEYQALTSVLTSFHQYGDWARRQIVAPRVRKWHTLSGADKALLPWFPAHIEALEAYIGMNEEFTQNLAVTVAGDWLVTPSPTDWSACSENDFEKVRLVLLQFTREWSEEGQVEREVAFDHIKAVLTARFPQVEARQHVKVLVPGAGLGRLVVDLVAEGFSTQGNEVSYHMLLASSFILNHTYVAHHYTLFPFVHRFSHTTKRQNQVRPVTVPDFHPGDVSALNRKYPTVPVGELMSMTAGSFPELYGKTATSSTDAEKFREENGAAWDVVATCFFLDTAANVVDYIRSIHHCLKPGGIWVNFGPLLWHHEGDQAGDDRGLELSRDDLLEVVRAMGLVFLNHESGIQSAYGNDPRAMGRWVGDCEFWVCQRPS